jgi:phosphopantothenate-cysteine ligase
MKKILVTAGGTQEYIDDVRVLTNISTGKLGSIITNELCDAGFKVYYICGKNSVMPNNSCYYVKIVKTANDAMEAMKKIIIDEQIDAVVHSMAVSDFTFKRDKSIKCKSNDTEGFIDFMRQMIIPNPKILSMIKQWQPETLLIGFKFEVGISENDLIALARSSIEKNSCDVVIANDKKEMEQMNSHIARFIFSEDMKRFFKDVKVSNKDEIAKTLRTILEVLLK